ncbi:beta-ketoacyl synthase [Alicyclobacillus sp. SO9]|uniref:beta-ketoacyl-[acyl-carrier-protein] synthase family protein n=1 Tax=Alicyclobacillus sp. SO9 TaxID=2665646 RepID=UPI0018E83711|nr:beta-ketoacyl-[acyl-carrier-protein] synthase family protein [Alicyclobacillus sp. SO9]QQE79101.1 beta-ketoacyl-[acyl-carrier-protein] synthase family protein [Alicyclobacillus sp. SO9]
MSQAVQIAITGLGAVTPYGAGTSAFWNGILEGNSVTTKMEDEELARWTPVAAQVTNVDFESYLGRKTVKDTDRFTQLALVAAQEALRDADLIDSSQNVKSHMVKADDVGIALGSAFGGVQSLEAGSAKLARLNTARVSPRIVSKSIPNAAAAAIAKEYSFRGPVMTYATACASAANAIGESVHWILQGNAEVIVAGGAECLFTPSVLAGLRAAGAVATTGPEDVRQWSRPFHRDRKGMVMGEGSALLVLETLEHAKARGAKVYGVLSGYGASNDAYHETSPHPEGAGGLLAMQRALRGAGLDPADIDYVNAHATATPAGDAAESIALRTLFGDNVGATPVSSIKGAVGHMLGTAGAIESIACVKALETGWLPPTINCDIPDELAPPDIVPQARRAPVRHVMSNSFGFGGQNGVLIWSQPE